MEVEIFERKFSYLSNATKEREDSFFYFEGQEVAKLDINFNVDNENNDLLLLLKCRGEVKIINKITGDRIDQDFIIENIKDDKELLDKIYRNKDMDIVLGNGFYMTCKLNGSKEININSDCYDIADLKVIMNSPNKIYEWYKFALEEQE